MQLRKYYEVGSTVGYQSWSQHRIKLETEISLSGNQHYLSNSFKHLLTSLTNKIQTKNI